MPSLASDSDSFDGESLETTASLLRRARSGDGSAQNRLFERYGQLLRRWAHGRFQHQGGDRDTQDLVQTTLLKALKHLDTFVPKREGAFLAYLRKTLKNTVLDEVRRPKAKPTAQGVPDDLEAKKPSPFDDLVSRETLQRYEDALEQFKPRTREALILRLEFGFSYGQIAEALNNRPEGAMHVRSENAVRMLIQRAIVVLAKKMGEP